MNIFLSTPLSVDQCIETLKSKIDQTPPNQILVAHFRGNRFSLYEITKKKWVNTEVDLCFYGRFVQAADGRTRIEGKIRVSTSTMLFGLFFVPMVIISQTLYSGDFDLQELVFITGFLTAIQVLGVALSKDTTRSLLTFLRISLKARPVAPHA